MKQTLNIILNLIILSSTVWAVDIDSPFSCSAGFQAYSYEYKEPGVMKDKGGLMGANVLIEYDQDFMLRGEGSFSIGTVDYTSQETGSDDDLEHRMIELRGLFGKSFESDQYILKATPYFGIAHRYLYTEGENRITTTGHWGYDRDVYYLYSPLGIEFEWQTIDDLVVKPTIEYDFFWQGTVKSHLSYLGDTDLEHHQSSGYGFRASVALESQTNIVNVTFKPFIRYWHIEESDWVYYTVEPENETLEVGLELNICF